MSREQVEACLSSALVNAEDDPQEMRERTRSVGESFRVLNGLFSVYGSICVSRMVVLTVLRQKSGYLGVYKSIRPCSVVSIVLRAWACSCAASVYVEVF